MRYIKRLRRVVIKLLLDCVPLDYKLKVGDNTRHLGFENKAIACREF